MWTRVPWPIQALLAGALLAVPFFPVPFLGLLLPVCLVPLALTARATARVGTGPGRTWLTGYLYALGFFLALFHWIPLLDSDQLVYEWIMGPAMVLMALYLAIMPGLAFWAACSIARRGRLSLVWLLPAAWALGEWLRTRGDLSLAWGVIGYALADHPVLYQTIDLYGMFGLAFVLVWIATVISAPTRRGLIAVGAVMVALLGYGWYQLSVPPSDEKLEVGLIQPNLTSREKWNADHEQLFAGYLELSNDAVPDSADLLVWPETATPFRLRDAPAYQFRIRRWVRGHHGTPLLTGTPDLIYQREKPVYHNAAIVFGPGASDTTWYAKRWLVPFSEWLPWHVLRVMEVNFGQADFTPGEEATVLPVDGHGAGVLICIEATYARLARDLVLSGADFLVNITNDVWFGDSAAPYQHAAMSRFRAVEFRRPLVRCANTGISMLVDEKGRVGGTLGTFVRGTIRGMIHPRDGLTLYARTGDWPVVVAAIGILLAGLWWRIPRRSVAGSR